MDLQEKKAEIAKISSISPVLTSGYAKSMFFSEKDLPEKTLETAKKIFKIKEGETVIYFYDQGNFKGSQGICVTDKTVYWRRTALTRAQSLPIADIVDAEYYDSDGAYGYIWFSTKDKQLNTYVHGDTLMAGFLKEIITILRLN